MNTVELVSNEVMIVEEDPMKRTQRHQITSVVTAGLLAYSLLFLLPSMAQAACDPPQKSRWGGMATLTDVCELGLTTTDASSDMTSSRGPAALAKQDRAAQFATATLESLTQDLAKGSGEYLSALATLLDVPADRQGTFFALAQEQYPLLAQRGDSSPVEMIRTLQMAMAGHPAFAQTVALR